MSFEDDLIEYSYQYTVRSRTNKMLIAMLIGKNFSFTWARLLVTSFYLDCKMASEEETLTYKTHRCMY